MVREYYVAMLLDNHISTFYMILYVSGGSYLKYTYMIDRKHSHVVLPDHASLSLILSPLQKLPLGASKPYSI